MNARLSNGEYLVAGKTVSALAVEGVGIGARGDGAEPGLRRGRRQAMVTLLETKT